MKRIMLLSARYPWAVLLVIAALTLLAALQLDRLRLDVSIEGMMLTESDEARFHRQVVDTFGSEELTILFVSDDELDQPRKLAAVESAVSRLNELPFVDRTESLFSINEISNVDDNITLSPYLAEIPDSREAALALFERASANPFVSGNLLADTAAAMAINIYIDDTKDAEFSDETVTTEIERVASALGEELDTVFQIGPSFIRDAISKRIVADQANLLPASLVILLFTLGLALRRPGGMLIPLLTAGTSIVWTLGLMAALDIPVNVMTSIVPALLIIIGSTEDIHLLSEYLAGRAERLPRYAAINRMSDRMSVAIMLTLVTTYFGFLSVALNDLRILQVFGLVASTGLLLNFLITVTLVPAVLSLLPERAEGTNGRRGSGTATIARVTSLLANRVRLYRRTTLYICLFIVVAAAYGAASIRVNNSSLSYFDDQSKVIQNLDRLQEMLSGAETLSIVVESGIEGTFLKLRYLEEMELLQEFLLDAGIADLSVGFVDYLKVMNRAMEGEDEEELYLPESDRLVAEYMLLINRKDIRGFVTDDFSSSRIVVRHRLESSLDLNRALEQIGEFVEDEMDPGLKVTVTGQSVLTAKAADYLATAQMQSLGLMIVVILVILSVLFIDLKAGIIAVIPNLFPIIILFGVMGYLDIPLDPSTAMTAAIAIGICVDDTMHFMVRYQEISKSESDDGKILSRTIEEESTPIVSTSFALALGFGALALSDFPPIAHFGLLSSLVMILALLATFAITPILLSYTRLITVWEMLGMHLKSQVLRRCRLFADMSPWQIKKTVLLSHIRTVSAGETVIEYGTSSDEFFVILEGETEARLPQPDSAPRPLRRMGVGEVFGEIALVSNSSRTADVVALTETRLLVMNWDRVQFVAKLYPRIASKLFRNLASILASKLT